MIRLSGPGSTRGHFGIGFYNPKYQVNAGTLIRSANAFGADYFFTIDDRYDGQASATGHDRHLPIFQYDSLDEWRKSIPFDTEPVAVEITPDATSLSSFRHPERASYLLGPEDGNVPIDGMEAVSIPSEWCLNVAIAGSIVLYDRIAKRNSSWAGRPLLPQEF